MFKNSFYWKLKISDILSQKTIQLSMSRGSNNKTYSLLFYIIFKKVALKIIEIILPALMLWNRVKKLKV